MSGRNFLVWEEYVENFPLANCEKFEGKTFHWFEFTKGESLWKKSSCDTDSLMDYIDAEKTRAEKRILAGFMKRGNCEVNEDSIWNLGERTVLVVHEPGMGKSSTTTEEVWHTKLASPTSWVVRINWNDHTRE